MYKLKCRSCDAIYIGETGRCAHVRFNEHAKRSGSGLTEFGRHLKDNPSHQIDFERDFEIVHAGLNFTRTRKLVEASTIQMYRSEANLLNDRLKSVELLLFNI